MAVAYWTSAGRDSRRPPPPSVHGTHEGQPPQLPLQPLALRPGRGPVCTHEIFDVLRVFGLVADPKSRPVLRNHLAQHPFDGVQLGKAEFAQVGPGPGRVEDGFAHHRQAGGRTTGRTGKERRGPAVRERRHLGAVPEPHQRQIRDPRSPDAVLAEGLVEPAYPFVAPGFQEPGAQAPENAVEPKRGHPGFVLERPAQIVQAAGRDALREPAGAARRREQRLQLVRPEQLAEPLGAREAGASPGDVAAAEAWQERLRVERRGNGLPKRREQRAFRKPVTAQRQRAKRLGVEQVPIPQPAERLDQSFGNGLDETVVPGIAGRHVVPRQGGAERPLDPKAEAGRERRGEEREERRVAFGDRLHATVLPEAEAHFHLARHSVGRARQGPREDQPALLGLPLPVGFPHQLHPPDIRVGIGFAEIQARVAILDPPLDLLDLAQEQQRPGSETAHRRPDLPGVGRGPQGKDEDRLVFTTRRPRRNGHRQDVVLDGEVLRSRMHFGPVGVGVHGLEADAEPADLGQAGVLGALADPADAAHVRLVERQAMVPDQEFGGADLEMHRTRTGPGRAPREGVLGVLQQFVDEVGAIAVAVGEELAAVVTDPRAVLAFVLPADRAIVGGHHGFASVVSRVVSSARPPRPGRAASSQRTRRPRRFSSS